MEYIDVTSDARKSRELRRSPSIRSRSHSRHRARSVSRSGLSIQSILGSGNPKNGKSRTPFFGGRPSSYYRRSPRRNYLARTFKKLRRLLRDLVFYMKRHPYQVLLLVIMPLILSGTLAKLLAKFGIRLPAGLQKALKIVTGGVRRIQSKSSSWSSSTRNILGGVGTLGGLLGMIKMIK